ncbi:MAG: DUF3540 domain-containing protein [Sandaracinaceae bacterium]|nr:MAG: DUF3540 domain-containing protein [Sandaracinaceae bacterium]HBQ17562.1 hypothetical protein [Myxococcales bacterium]
MDSDPRSPELCSPSGVTAALEDQQRLRVRAPDGRLLLEVEEDGTIALLVPRGDLHLKATEGRVLIEGKQGVEIRGPVVRIDAQTLRQRVGSLETRARRIVEKTKDVYRDAEGVSQTRAGQIKLVAEKTLRAVASRLRLRAKKDAKVLADKIYLG